MGVDARLGAVWCTAGYTYGFAVRAGAPAGRPPSSVGKRSITGAHPLSTVARPNAAPMKSLADTHLAPPKHRTRARNRCRLKELYHRAVNGLIWPQQGHPLLTALLKARENMSANAPCDGTQPGPTLLAEGIGQGG